MNDIASCQGRTGNVECENKEKCWRYRLHKERLDYPDVVCTMADFASDWKQCNEWRGE